MIAILAASVIATCSWDAPGANKFTGDRAAAVDHYTDIPKDVRSVLRDRILRRQYDDTVSITRNTIGSQKHDYVPEISGMHFGANSLCQTVARDKWKPGQVERALVFCEGQYCIAIPTVCGNVGRLTRLPQSQPAATSAAPASSEGGGGGGIYVKPNAWPVLQETAPPAEIDVSEPTKHSLLSQDEPVFAIPPFYWPMPPMTYIAPTLAVPEPPMWALALLGIAAIGLFRRYRR